jgi:hypothetical protein
MNERKMTRLALNPEQGDTCIECLWFGGDVLPSGRIGMKGKCRRHPPTVVVTHEGTATVWPLVNRFSDVCGDGESLPPDNEPDEEGGA